MYKKKEGVAGMTFVEMIVVIFIFSLVMIALGDSVAALYKLKAYTISQTYQVSNARRGTQAFIRDIREMTFADNGTFPLARMDDHIIGFYSDIDRDNSVEYVEYELDTTILTKRIYNATGSPAEYDTSSPDESLILSEYVQNIIQGTSTFLYYDTNGGLMATSSEAVTDVRYITIQLIVNIDPIRNPGQFMMRSSATLRNVIDNL
jgi:hypothetical protein